MYEIKKCHIEKGKYKMGPIKYRNILLVGRTLTGKSTFKSVLVDPTTICEKRSLFSGTKNPLFEPFSIDGEQIVLNVIDTPGLFERRREATDIRDNATILESIRMCVNRKVTQFHVICYFISVLCGMDESDLQVIQLLSAYLGLDASRNSCLIITGSESKDEAQCDKIRFELRDDPHFKWIVPIFGQGVFFSGSLDRHSYENGSESLFDQFITISKYRSKLIELFKSDIEPISIHDMFGGQRTMQLCKSP
jgi:hypothetical protein